MRAAAKSAALIAFSLVCAATAQAQPKPTATALQVKPVITQTTLTAKDLSEVQSLLKTMSPTSFNMVISQTGKTPIRLGNAAIKDLSTVSVFHAPGSVAAAGNEIVTSVDNYVKVVWTSNVSGADKATMDKVNAILAKAR